MVREHRFLRYSGPHPAKLPLKSLTRTHDAHRDHEADTAHDPTVRFGKPLMSGKTAFGVQSGLSVSPNLLIHTEGIPNSLHTFESVTCPMPT